jgi:hypothetical protein
MGGRKDERFEAEFEDYNRDVTGKGTQSKRNQPEDGNPSENHP